MFMSYTKRVDGMIPTLGSAWLNYLQLYICQFSSYSHLQEIYGHITLPKATFSFHKLIPKNAQMTAVYTNWSLYITFTMIYYIRQE